MKPLDPTTLSALRRGIPSAVRTEGRKAYLGKVDGTLSVELPDGTTDPRRVYVRTSGTSGSVTEAAAWANGIPRILNLPVRVANLHNDPWIVGPDGQAAEVFLDGQALLQIHAPQHGRFGADPLYITGLQFLPLATTPTSPASLSVYVQPGWYRYLGTWNKWEGGSTDLTAYVPASAGVTHFVIVTLDRVNNVLVVVDGADITGDALTPGTVSASDIKAITVADAYFPLAAVELVKGQTEIKPHSIDDDLRLWGLEVPAASGDVTGPDSSTDNAIARWDGTSGDTLQNSNVTIDDNGHITLPAASLLETPTDGTLEYDGHSLNFTPAADRRSINLSNGVVLESVTVANTTTETTVYTEPVSANEMFRGSKWHTRISGYYSTANASDTFTFRLKVGGTTVLTLNSAAENVTDGFWRAEFFFTVRSTGSTGAIQAAVEGVFNNTAANAVNTSTTTIDTGTAEDITATVQWDSANAGNSFTLAQGHTDIFGTDVTGDILLLETGDHLLLENGDFMLLESS